MEVFEDKAAMRDWTGLQKLRGKSVALVPTMGYLHEGHLSLVRSARELCDLVVVSIYVNPSQFGPSEDLDRYPRDVPGDLKKLEALEVAAAFCPKDLYTCAATAAGGPHQSWVTVEQLELPLCGRGRPGHFRGVATVVAKLFNVVAPDVAVFGKKDFQQFRLISQMTADLDFPVRIVGAPLMRERDGLAMSSRNVRLTPEQRQQALCISRGLREAERRAGELLASAAADEERRAQVALLPGLVRDTIQAAGGRVEYVELVEVQSLQQATDIVGPTVMAVAAFFGAVRLIDNIEMPSAARQQEV